MLLDKKEMECSLGRFVLALALADPFSSADTFFGLFFFARFDWSMKLNVRMEIPSTGANYSSGEGFGGLME